MIINKITKYRRLIICGLLPFLLTLLIKIESFAQNGSDELKAENVKWTVKNENILIYYDLQGSPDVKYDVSVKMKRESDSSFVAIPATVEGDIGQGYYAGLKKEILWHYRFDFPEGLQGQDYYFEIYVKEAAKQKYLLYYIAGGAAIIAGIVALLVNKNPGTPPPRELPYPPVRP
jgi:hypothetical protein